MSPSPPRSPLLAFALVAALVLALLPATSLAQDDSPEAAVTGLTVTQRDGYATLGWDPFEGASEYEIERTPVDEAGEPTGASVVVGRWRPNRQVQGDQPSFADAGFVPGERYRWRVRPVLASGLPNRVTIASPSAAAGTYDAHGASFGPAPDAGGVTGDVVLVNSTTGAPTEGCGPLDGFPAGAIALVDRGTCPFVQKVNNAQDAGALAVIVANNTGGAPTNMGGSDPGVVIPAVMVSQADGTTIKAGLPASGSVASAPEAPFSDAVVDTTLPSYGPEEFLTQFELTNGAQFTSYDFEIDWTERIAAASDRVRVVKIGETVLGRDINLFVIGYPAPLDTAEEISASPSAGVNCNVHGNEPSGREGCFMLIRDLAFSDDERVVDILSNATVLIVPSINGDGRAANNRGNATGQDLNRDHALITQPETFSFAAFLRDYTPEVMADGHEFGNTGTCDLPLLWPRHSNTAPTVHDESKEGLVEGWFYNQGADDGWWPCPYPAAGIAGAQTFTRVTGLKNMVVTLVEARSSGGPTRPGQGGSQSAAYRRLKAYSQLWSYNTTLDYHRANQEAVAQAIADGIAFQTSNTGPVVFHGDWDVEAFPAPHPGDSPPPNNPPGPNQMLDPAPCGYLLTEAQYSGPRSDGPPGLTTTVAERLDAHGIRVVAHGTDRYYVPLAQPLRGLINIVVDGQTPPQPLVAAERVYPCYAMGGFEDPIDGAPAVNTVLAGAARPVKFSLDGDQGMAILAEDSPTSRPIDCATLRATGPAERTATAGGSGLQYDAQADTYTYVWRTSSAWSGTCREFALALDDGTSHAAYFQFD